MRKKHRHGEGSITKIGECKWMAKWIYRGVSHTKRITAPTREKAEEELARLTLPNRASTIQDRQQILMAQSQDAVKRIEAEKYRLSDFDITELEEKYISHPNYSAVTKSTSDHIHQNLNFFIKWCKSNFIDTIHTVDVDVISRFLNYMQSEKPNNTYNIIIKTLKKVWKTLAKTYRLDTSIWDDIKFKKTVTTPKRNLTQDEIKKLMDYLKTQKTEDRVFWGFGLYCGMRRKDASEVMWSNVDLEKRIIRYIPTKTSRWNTTATAPIHQDLYDLLTTLKAEKLSDVYVTPSYQCIARESLRYRVAKVFRKIGIETKDDNGKVVVGYHSLRHGLITMLLDNNVPLVEIAQIVGHRTKNAYAMTLSYHNITKDVDARSVECLDFGGSTVKDDRPKESKSEDDKDAIIEKLRKENEELKARLEKIKSLFNV